MRAWMFAVALSVAFSAVAVGQGTVTYIYGKRSHATYSPVEIVIDFKNNLALVPEGTILPPGLKVFVRYGKYSLNDPEDVRAFDEQRRLRSQRIAGRRPAERVPLVFAYAPESVFVPYRKTSEPTRLKSTNYCPPIVRTYGPIPGCNDCTATFYSNSCDDYVYPYRYYCQTYSAEITPANTGYSWVEVWSTDGYFSCANQVLYPSVDVSCDSTDSRDQCMDCGYGYVATAGYDEWWVGTDVFTWYIEVDWLDTSCHKGVTGRQGCDEIQAGGCNGS